MTHAGDMKDVNDWYAGWKHKIFGDRINLKDKDGDIFTLEYDLENKMYRVIE